MAWAAVRQVAAARAALATALLAATNPMLVWICQEARSYSLAVLLATVSVYWCLRALRTRSPRDVTAWAAAAVLAPLTHYFTAFVLIPQGALLLARLPEQRRRLLAAIAGIVAVGAALVPLVAHQVFLQPRGTSVNWIDSIPLGDRLSEVVRELAYFNTDLISSNSPPPGLGLRWLALAIVVLGVAGAIGSGSERRAAFPLAAVGMAGVLLPLLLAVTPLDTFKDRNVLASWVPLLGVLGIGLTSRRLGVVGPLAVLALAGTGLAVAREVLRDPALQRHNWRALGAALDRPERARALVVMPDFLAATALARYGHPSERWRPGTRVDELVLAGELGAVAADPPTPRGFRRVETRQVFGLYLVRFRARGGVPRDPGSVRIGDSQMFLERP